MVEHLRQCSTADHSFPQLGLASVPLGTVSLADVTTRSAANSRPPGPWRGFEIYQRIASGFFPYRFRAWGTCGWDSGESPYLSRSVHGHLQNDDHCTRGICRSFI